MPDKPNEAQEERPEEKDRKEEKRGAGGSDPSQKSRRRPVLWIGVVLCLVLLTAFAAQGFGLIPPVLPFADRVARLVQGLPWIGTLGVGGDGSAASRDLSPVFSSGSSGDLVSKRSQLVLVGRGPVDPSRVLFPTFEQVPPRGKAAPKGTCPPIKGIAPSTEGAEKVPGGGTGDAAVSSPRLVETPIVVSKGPGKASKMDGAEKPGGSRKATESEAPGKDGGGEAAQIREKPSTGEIADKVVPERTAKTRGGVTGSTGGDLTGGADGSGATLVSRRRSAGAPADEKESKPEKYQLPGSLRVSVSNYKGSKVKWGLMVILDDSASMGRKAKPWKPDRFHAAIRFVGKLKKALTPGSKLAVRDFYCGKSRRRRRRGLPLCLSHLLFPWSAAPFQGLKDKLGALEPYGRTNPCAAAAFVVKKDFRGLDGLTPRAILVTNGVRKCGYKEILRIIDRKHGSGKLRVDVLALGMSKRRRRGYSRLCAKSGGTFLHLKGPSEIDKAVSSYSRILKTPALKKMEVRGGKTNLFVSNGQEVTLAPGSYTIILPVIPGLKASHRTIKDVKIKSGENKVLRVKISRGRLIVRKGKP